MSSQYVVVECPTGRLHEQRVGKAKTDSDVSSFDIWLAVDERFVRLGGAREKRGPPLHALAVCKAVGLEVELISALIRPPPCVEIKELFR